MGGFRYRCSKCLKTVHVYCSGAPSTAPPESQDNCEEPKLVQQDTNPEERENGGDEGILCSNSPTAANLPQAPTGIAATEPIGDSVAASHASSLDFQNNTSATSPPDAIPPPALSSASPTGMLTHQTTPPSGTTTRSVSSITDSFVYLKFLLSGGGGAERPALPVVPEDDILHLQHTTDTHTEALLSAEPSKSLETEKTDPADTRSVEENAVPWVSCAPLDIRAVDELPQVENLEATLRLAQDVETFLTSSTTQSLAKAQERERNEMLFCNSCLNTLQQKAEDATKNLEAELQLYTEHWETLPGILLQRYHLHRPSAQGESIHESGSGSSRVSQAVLSASNNQEWNTDEGSEAERSGSRHTPKREGSSSLSSENFHEGDVSITSEVDQSGRDVTNAEHAEAGVSVLPAPNLNQNSPENSFAAPVRSPLRLSDEALCEAASLNTVTFKSPDGGSGANLRDESLCEVSGFGTSDNSLRDVREVQYSERPDRDANPTFPSAVQKNIDSAVFKDLEREGSLQMKPNRMEQGASWPTRESIVTARNPSFVSPFLANNLILSEELQTLVKRRDALRKKKANVKKSCAKYERLYAELQTLCLEQSTRFSALEARARFSAHHANFLAKSNAINDAFHIGVQKIYGTINHIRLGKTPNDDVTWDEVNAAWGQTALLLDCLIQLTLDIYNVCSISSSPSFRELDTSGKLPQLDHLLSYRILPRGSQSAVLRRSDSSMYELYGTGGGISKFFATRRFDSAMVVVLGVTKDLINLAAFLGDFLSFSRETLRPPFRVTAETIGGVSIRLPAASGGEEWCRCLKYLLLNLKWLLGIGEGLLALSYVNAPQS